MRESVSPGPEAGQLKPGADPITPARVRRKYNYTVCYKLKKLIVKGRAPMPKEHPLHTLYATHTSKQQHTHVREE